MTADQHTEPKRYVLDNGLAAIIEERPESDTVFCGLYVRVGSRYETRSNNGTSHFLEHLLFREESAAPTVKQIEATGGSVNGMTTFEYTAYFFDTLASEFGKAWDGLYRLVCDPGFGEEKVELERDIIMREVAGIKSNPLAIAFYAAMRKFLPNTSLARPIPGTRRSLARIRYADIREFYDTYYVPNNMFLVIAGGVKAEYAIQSVRCAFADRRAGPEPPKRFTLPPRQSKRRELRLKTLVDQGYMAIGVRTDGETDRHKHELKFIDVILGSGRNSRIYKELKVKRGMTDFIASAADMAPAGGGTLSDLGFWGLAVGTSPKDLPETRRIIEREMTRIKDEPLSIEEFETARNNVLGGFAIACETNSGRAGFYAATELAGGLLSVKEFRSKIEAVTRDGIAEAAGKRFEDKEIMLLDVKPARALGKALAVVRYLIFARM